LFAIRHYDVDDVAAKCASIVSIAGGDAVKRRGPAKVQKPVDNSLVAPKPRDMLIDLIKWRYVNNLFM
jgi:hypothetical protein